MEYYFIKDMEGNNLPDTEGIKLIDNSITIHIPGDNRNKEYSEYLEWKAEGNTAQTEA